MVEAENDMGQRDNNLPDFVPRVSHDTRLRELLRNIVSIEYKLYSDACEEFRELLRSEEGGKLLYQYIHWSATLSELLDVWKLRAGKPEISHLLFLTADILGHPDGVYKADDTERISISKPLDKFARLIIEEKMGDVYVELNSKEGKRQTAALLLIASIVRRGTGLASEVARTFDFKLEVLRHLAEHKQDKSGRKRKRSTRESFIRFAISFLEVGDPKLLRWVLQQREIYSRVLRGIGHDDEDVIVYVLSTLRSRILTPESLLPPGLRSVLFGSATLDQLISITEWKDGGSATDVAHSVLVMVCTDPSNGLMPDLKRHPSPLRGNPKRLLGLMKKLKAGEIGYHRDLLLAIIDGRPSFGSAYMNEFPYSLEDHASSTWLDIVLLAANLVSAVGNGHPFDFLDTQSQEPPLFDSFESIVKCICPRPFSRLVINKGLLHPDFLVKHGTLKLLLESLKLLDSFVGAINNRSFSCILMMQKWEFLKQNLQNEVQAMLPDPQVLLTLHSSLSTRYKNPDSSLKRAPDSENNPHHRESRTKRSKNAVTFDDNDILVGGISGFLDVTIPGKDEDVSPSEEMDNGKEHLKVVSEIWGSHLLDSSVDDAEIYFHSKLLEALRFYLRTMPSVLEGSFDIFKNLLYSLQALSTTLQRSLLSLLIEYIGCCPGGELHSRSLPLMYKYLQPLINLLILSPIRDIKDHAYALAQAAMRSTGAFDRNLQEIGAWFLFLPGYGRNKLLKSDPGLEAFKNFSSVVVSFLCDSVSTVGNNLFKYWDLLRCQSYHIKKFKDVSPDFSPLVICALQKCLRLLQSESETFTLPEKSMISFYVCDTLTFLLQTQVHAGPLAAIIDSILSEGLGDHCSMVKSSGGLLCEWSPLEVLLQLSRRITHPNDCNIFSISGQYISTDSSFSSTLIEVREVISSENTHEMAAVAKAFSSLIICTSPAEIIQNFPLVITMSHNLFGVPFSLLSSLLFLEQSFLTTVSKLWPELFSTALDFVLTKSQCEGRHGEAGRSTCPFCNEEDLICSVDLDSQNSAVVAFGSFLYEAPFCVLFPAMIAIDGPYLLESSKIQDLLLAKLGKETYESMLSSLRLVLFWAHRIQSSYRVKPLGELEKLFDQCLTIIEHMLVRSERPDTDYSVVLGAPFSTKCTEEMVETIFSHPAVMSSLACPLGCNNLMQGPSGDSLENFLDFCRNRVHKMDHDVLSLLIMVSDRLFAQSDGQNLVANVDRRIVKAFRYLIEKVLLEFKDKFELSIRTKDLLLLLPIFYVLYMLIRFISPFDLLELVFWMFSCIPQDFLTCRSSKISPFSVGFCVASGAFDMLSSFLEQSSTTKAPNQLIWETEESKINVDLFERVTCKIFEFATSSKLEFADFCFLKAVEIAYCQKFMQQQSILHPLNMLIFRVIVSTPTEMISHCICETNSVKAKVLFLLTEISPLHSSIFGHLFMSILENELHFKGAVAGQTYNYALSEEDFMMLLPVSLSFINSSLLRFGNQYKHYGRIPSFYSRILLDGFLDWKNFVSKGISKVESGEFSPSSTEELLNYCRGSLLGKSICMLRHYFALNSGSLKLKKQLKLFNAICQNLGPRNELLHSDLSDLDASSHEQSLKIINEVVGKIDYCRMLLFPEDDQAQIMSKQEAVNSNEKSLESEFNKMDMARAEFIDALVDTWHLIVKRFPTISSNSGKIEKLFKLMEIFVIKSIFELTKVMERYLIQLHSVPFLEKLAKFALLFRFGDPITLKMLRGVVTSLSKRGSLSAFVLQLLLAHSHFAPTINSIVKNSSSSHVGSFFGPTSSILKSVVVPVTERSGANGKSSIETSNLSALHLEFIKLLRVLFRYGVGSEKDAAVNSKELLSLLLSCYGATLFEIDLEIYSLMREIETIYGSESGGIAEMDYLWGNAAFRIRNGQSQDQETLPNSATDMDGVGDCHRRQFRESLPIDPKFCVTTVLCFPFDRSASANSSPMDKLSQNHSDNTLKGDVMSIESMRRYDPVYILRFSIHSLSLGYIDPVDFARLGLLAVAFVSLSSPDETIRKLGYEAIGRFKNALETFQTRKDVARLRLLLTYLQNGIEEAWQRVPSVIALFAAEASFVLLDHSHDYFKTMSKHLMSFPKVNMKLIPLFHDLYWSSSANFKADRLWILRLLYAGLNTDDDAWIYIRNSVPVTLLSFYASSLSDNESKELIILIVKKSIDLPKMAHYLVEQCGIISWLSSVITISKAGLCGSERSYLMAHLTGILDVVNDLVSCGTVTDWLQKHALEQLSELSSNLCSLLVCVEFKKEKFALVNLIVEVLTSTLKLSQERNTSQPHFTLSVEGLYQIYLAVDACNNAKSSFSAELGLKAILMSTPPTNIISMDGEKLNTFVLWAISTALYFDSKKMLQLNGPSLCRDKISEEEQPEDTLLSKLLRWLSASVILGNYPKDNDLDSNFSHSNSETLHSLIERVQCVHRNKSRAGCGSKDVLAASIFYLQQLLGVNCRLLPLWFLFCRSYYQPWEDHSYEKTASEKLDELQACQSLLLIISRVLEKKPVDLESIQELENSGVYKWERNTLEGK
ncbi:LOW QUALITY PROTEIN: Nucleolar pre-ribosomal-associated protein 1, N-terminal [Dillenia turbinata]|uniref:Nucleolar pre-ribosomal-associated protein 1, N-terminal n=1 Tax=Dillenia turbinata TaxID=194707 RepID=A0AAN8ZVN3_9MAGN